MRLFGYMSKKLELVLSATLVALTGFFAYKSTPVNDDYCFALGAAQNKILENTIYYTTNWSPLPLGYLIQNSWWAISKDGVFSASVITLSTFAFFVFALFYLFSLFLQRKDRIYVIILIGIFFSSIALSKTGTFLTYSHPAPGNYPIIELGKKIIVGLPDGRLSYWYFNSPLISTRTIIIASIFLYAGLWINKQKTFTYHLLIFSIFVVTQSITESIFVGVALVFYIFLSIKGRTRVNINTYISAGILIFVPVLLAFFGGTKNRQTSIPDFEITIFAYKSILILVYLVVTVYLLNTFILGAAAAIIFKKYCTEIDFDVVRSLRNFFALLALSAFLVEPVISSYSYSAEYHWTTLHAFSFAAQFFAVLYWQRDRKLYANQKAVFLLMTVFVFSVSIIITFQNTALSSDRAEKWKERSKTSISRMENSRIPLPRTDLRSNPLITDLDKSYRTIIPGKGYVSDAGYLCYKDLPLGW